MFPKDICRIDRSHRGLFSIPLVLLLVSSQLPAQTADKGPVLFHERTALKADKKAGVQAKRALIPTARERNQELDIRELTPGVTQAFAAPAVSGPSLLSFGNEFSIDVPDSASRLNVSLVTNNDRVDLDLFVGSFRDNGETIRLLPIVGPTGYESISIARNSSLELQSGPHLFTIAVFTPNRPITGTILATLDEDDPYVGGQIFPGRPTGFLFSERPGPTLYGGENSFRFEVPANATRLIARARTIQSSRTIDIDLFIRKDEEPDIINGQVRATYEASGLSGDETIDVSVDDVARPLEPGTYFLSLVVWNDLDELPGLIDVTIETTDPAPTPASLELSQQSLTFGGESDPMLADQIVEIRNGGDGPLGFVIQSNQSWLKPSAFGGTSDGVVTFDEDSEVTTPGLTAAVKGQADPFFALTVSVDTSGLDEGTYTGELTIIGPPAQTQVIPVTANVAAPGLDGPSISQGGAVNAADFTEAFAPGSIISLFGREFSAESFTAAAIPLPVMLDTASVAVLAGNSSLAAPFYYLSPGQINAQLPYGLIDGPVDLQVSNANGMSETTTVTITSAAPRLFTLDGGTGTAIALKPDGSLVGPDNPVEPGGIIVLYLIGLGEVSPPLTAGEAAGDGAAGGALNIVAGVTVTVGGEPANVLFAGLTPYFVGLYQINIEVSAALASGDQPLLVSLGGASSQAAVTVPVAAVAAGLEH